MEEIFKEIISAGKFLDQKGLCPATSGNISHIINDQLIAITASGKHKGYLDSNDLVLINRKGEVEKGFPIPSAETLLHTTLYMKDVKAVIHTHSLNGTLLSFKNKAPYMKTYGYEIHKAFPGFKTHDSELVIPIFDNSQDIENLSQKIALYLKDHPSTVGYLLRGHGLYTWGRSMHEAKIRVEAFEFLFACEVQR